MQNEEDEDENLTLARIEPLNVVVDQCLCLSSRENGKMLTREWATKPDVDMHAAENRKESHLCYTHN